MTYIDYSKWDKIKLDSDDETDQEYTQPSVTRFDSPKLISLKDGAYSIEESIERNLTSNLKSDTLISYEKTLKIDDLQYNGGHDLEGRYYWSQTKVDIRLYIIIDDKIDSKYLKVFIKEDNITIKYNDTIFFEKEFSYNVEDDEDMIFWSVIKVKDNNTCKFTRMICIELKKKKLIDGVNIWWRSMFKDGASIDINDLEDRKNNKTLNKNEEFLKSWNEAHKRFLEGIKEKKSKGDLPILL
ncbi:hypothetical protein ACR3K2_18400 [Cryptosporidium serpentis]